MLIKNGAQRFARRAALAAFALFIAFPIAAQLTDPPLDARRYDWKQIETKHYQVIFPDFLEEQGRYVASTLEYLWPLQQHSILPVRLFKYPVILNPDQVSPNGYVNILPRRSYFYTVPDTSTCGDWLTLLCAHEGRHMFQFSAMDQGTIHALSFLFGEYAAAPAVSAPGWWFEGDAVMTETTLTETGRGRNPRFTAQFKALMLDGKDFGYNKMLLGSYRDYTPNAYEFGYLMYAYIRSQYDPKAPDTLISTFAKCPLPALGPYRATRKACGKGASAVYREMAARYARFWKDQVARLDLTPVTPLAAQGRSSYREHRAMAVCADGSVVASVVDLDRFTEIVKVSDGKERVLCKGYPLNSLSAGGRYIAWDALEQSAKYDSSASRIILYDLETGRKRTLFSGSRFIAPALSPDGSALAMIDFRRDGSSALALASTRDGAILREYPIPAGEAWRDLSFSESGKELVFVAAGALPDAGFGGKRIERMALDTGTVALVYDGGNENVQTPALSGTAVYYVSNLSGIDAVWAIDGDGNRYQVISRPIGAYFPKPVSGSDRIRFVDYANSRGTVIAEADVPRSAWVTAEKVAIVREDFFAAAAEGEPGKGMVVPKNVPITDIPATGYSPARSGNRLDAWGIAPLADGDVGVTCFANIDNVTGLMNQQISLTYDDTDRSLGGGYLFRYRGFWPDIVVKAGSTLKGLDGEVSNEPWGSVGLELPIAGGTVGAASWKTVLGASGGGRVDDGDQDAVLTVYGTETATAGRWALSVSASWEYLPMAAGFADHPFAYAAFATPGLLAKDSFTLTGAYESRHDGDDALSLSYARGYYGTGALEAWKASAAYSVPLFFPDFAIGSLCYFDMIRLNAFYDYRDALDIDETQSSVGAELLFHFIPLQIPVELNAGFRYSRRIRENENCFDVVILGIPIASSRR